VVVNNKEIKVLISGGGTAGHINPALTIAKKIKEYYPNAKFLFVGTANGLEARLVPQEGYEIKFIKVSGLIRKLSLQNLLILRNAIKAVNDSKKIIKNFKPDIVIGTGGYVSGPVIYAATKLKIKTAIHEQNAFWGITTRFLAKRVDRIMLSFPNSKKVKKNNKKVFITGNPIREEFLHIDKHSARRVLDLDTRPLIFSYGGSGGANKINTAFCHMLSISKKEKLFNHIHGTGKRDYYDVLNYLKKENININNNDIRVLEYVYDMPRVMAAADLVVCRSGAITLAELAVLGKPSILIPSPNVTENHQYYNAKVFEDNKAALIIEDKDLTGELLYEKIKNLFINYDNIIAMSHNAKSLAIKDANEKICKVITELLECRM